MWFHLYNQLNKNYMFAVSFFQNFFFGDTFRVRGYVM
jgi:hypothetical protein